MAYKRIKTLDIWEIIRRHQAGQGIRLIARSLGYDRKSVRKYINHLRSKGILDSGTAVDKEEVVKVLQGNVLQRERSSQKQSLLQPHLEELKGLITQDDLKPKTAFSVICQRHDLAGKVSYTSLPVR